MVCKPRGYLFFLLSAIDSCFPNDVPLSRVAMSNSQALSDGSVTRSIVSLHDAASALPGIIILENNIRGRESKFR